METAEKRRATRHRVSLPITFEDGTGVTRDFSSVGVFFETDKSFVPGQAITFTVQLKHVDPIRPVQLKCRGAIVRVEQRGKKIGIAADIDTVSFEDA